MVNKGKVKWVDVYYTGGNKISTDVNPNLTDKEIKDYWKIGSKANIGDGERDRIVKIKRVVIHRER